MDKFLKVTTDKLEIRISVTKQSEIVKNPIPILWEYKGFYGWIPVEMVINERDLFIHNETICPGLVENNFHFTWQQAFPLRQDVGKILEEMGNEN